MKPPGARCISSTGVDPAPTSDRMKRREFIGFLGGAAAIGLPRSVLPRPMPLLRCRGPGFPDLRTSPGSGSTRFASALSSQEASLWQNAIRSSVRSPRRLRSASRRCRELGALKPRSSSRRRVPHRVHEFLPWTFPRFHSYASDREIKAVRRTLCEARWDGDRKRH